MYIYKAAVVGAGAMGAEIAQVISYSGLPVVIKDVNQELVDKGLAKIRSIYEGRVKKGKMSESDVASKLALVTGTTSYDDLKDADIIVEAVSEKMEIKKKVFAELDKAVQPSAILSSNTSSLSISALGSATARPGKVVGMHFFYPAHVMKLVEVIPGLATATETVEDTMSFAESLRKIPVKVNECAGFLVNRLLMPYLNEAAYCLQEGAASMRDIDQAVVAFGLPMGPFTLVDNLGIDVCAEVVKVLLESYGNRMAPAQLWQKMIDAKRFGMKSGGGFYDYGGETSNFTEKACAEIQKETGKRGSEFSIERLIYPMINEAALCLEEHVASARDIDISLLTGIGFPQDKGGALKYADSVGLDVVLKKLEEYYQKFGARFFPAPLIRRMVYANFLGVKTKRGFFTEY
jgi:3-hydroxyacyl-CoA dehydrogenase